MGGGRVLIGGMHTCPGAPELQAKESLVRGALAGVTAEQTDRGEGPRGTVPGWTWMKPAQTSAGREWEAGGREPALPFDPQDSPSGPWVFLIQASAVGVGAQGWAWGPHGETVTPLGEEATPSSGNSQASWEGSDGSQRAGGPALVNKLLDMEGAALNPPSPP